MDEGKARSALRANLRYLFITRGRPILVERLSTLTELEAQITDTKKKHISQKDEQNANKWLSLEELCKSMIAGVKLLLELKNSDPDQAWLHLVDAQNRIHRSNAAYDLNEDLQKDLVRYFYNIEKVVFPPQRFQSISVTTKKSLCSICDRPFHECDHIRGEPYMGELCGETVTELGPANHVAFVDYPADKKCRITHTGNTNPPKTNWMTLEDDG